MSEEKSVPCTPHSPAHSFVSHPVCRLLFGRLGFVETSNFEVRSGKRKCSVADGGPSAKRSRQECTWKHVDDKRLLLGILEVQSVQRSAFDKIAATMRPHTANQCYRRFTDWLQHFNVRPRYLRSLRTAIRVARRHWPQSNAGKCPTTAADNKKIGTADRLGKETDGSSQCRRVAGSDRALEFDKREALNNIICIYHKYFERNVGVT